jgi:predicted nucleic acid-binding protein
MGFARDGSGIPPQQASISESVFLGARRIVCGRRRTCVDTAEADKLDTFLDVEQIITGDFILTEVLQGFISEREFNQGRKLLASLPMIPLVGEEIAVQAARNFRKLRTLGITIRKTIDTLIATSCIEKKISLLYSDRDFDPFVQHLGLRNAN